MPANFRSLLGLGLSFCPRPDYTTGDTINETTARFRKDIYTRCFYAGIPSVGYDPKLHIKSDREAPLNSIPRKLIAMTDNFLGAIKKLFRKRQSPPNLLPAQRFCLRTLKARTNLMVVRTDKNLGPAVVERRVYADRAMEDHLSDQRTYSQVFKYTAEREIGFLKETVLDWMKTYKLVLSKQDKKYLQRSLVMDPTDIKFAQFYLTFKIHKTPWKTRPIVSVSGSLLHGLGKWIDTQLQPIGQATPSFINSSYSLVKILKSLPVLPATTRIFTCDAVSMYTNICTHHALNSLRAAQLVPEHVLAALEIVMKTNYFQFSDTYWYQKEGTAMGTPPACMWATIYFSPHEELLRERYKEYLLFYKRYIDDGFGLWNWTGTQACITAWTNYCADMQTYGLLRWTMETPGLSANYLDLTVSIRNGVVSSTLYEKALNLYLYLPPHSAHAPGVLKGLLSGMILRIFRLTSDVPTRNDQLQTFFTRLVARGYQAPIILPLFNACIAKYTARLDDAAGPDEAPVDNALDPEAESKNRIFLHLPFHPLDPPSSEVQRLFREHMLRPSVNPYIDRLPTVKNHRGFTVGIERLIVAYHRPNNLANLLTPRKFDSTSGPPMSVYLTDARRRAAGCNNNNNNNTL